MSEADVKLLGDTLLKRKIITEEQLSRALDLAQALGKPLARILLDLGYVQRDELERILGTEADTTEEINAEGISISPSLVKRVPAAVAHAYHVMPLREENGRIVFAMTDPFNIRVLDDLRFRLGVAVRGVAAMEDAIQQLILEHYGSKGGTLKEVVSEMREHSDAENISAERLDTTSLKELAQQAPVVKLLNLILLQGVRDRASDIHLEPFEHEFKVRYRVDGTLYELTPPPKLLALALTSRVKVMAGLDIAERRLPQDGRIQVSVDGRVIDIRVSILPTAFGESVVLRILDKSIVQLSLDQLGFSSDIRQDVAKLIERPNGIVLVTGPTGSGKTTTLYSMLRAINDVGKKIITTEDPVEYELEGIVQVPIQPKIDLNFARSLRSILRQDPDIVMVGEIRDEETAEIAVQASLTGHLVLSTLHTNDAPGAVTRLLDMKIEPYLVTSSLTAVLAQRLVRAICRHCRESYEPSEEILRDLGVKSKDRKDHVFYSGRGCSECGGSGYSGRTAVFELFIMNDVLREMVLEGASTVSIREKAREFGMRMLREEGLRKIFEGITTVEEVLRETQLYE